MVLRPINLENLELLGHFRKLQKMHDGFKFVYTYSKSLIEIKNEIKKNIRAKSILSQNLEN